MALTITNVLEAILYDVEELKVKLNEEDAYPGCCRMAYKQAIKEVLEIINGYNNRDYQEFFSKVYNQSQSKDLSQ